MNADTIQHTEAEVQYHFDYNLFGDDALALEAHKTWREADGRRGHDLLVLDLYDGDAGDGQVVQRFEAEVERLTALQQTAGLEAAMQEAERIAVVNGQLDERRDDPRLFTAGPPDPFTTLRERELTIPEYGFIATSADDTHYLHVTKSWGDDGYQTLAIPQPSWEEAQLQAALAFNDQQNDDLERAMHRIELAGMAAGVIDPDRDDPRLFTEGPPDPFETLAERLRDEINPYWNTSGEQIEPTPPPQITPPALDFDL